MMKTSHLLSIVLLALIVGLPTGSTQDIPGSTPVGAGPPAARDAVYGRPVQPPDAFGTSGWNVLVISPNAFHPYNVGKGYVYYNDGYIGPQSDDIFRYFDAPVNLPSGALVDYCNFSTYDADTSGNETFSWVLVSCAGNAPCTSTTIVTLATSVSGAPGYAGDAQVFSTPLTWKNTDRSKDPAEILHSFVRIHFSEGDDSLRAGLIAIWYKRQISPPPATATFPDVPTSHWAFQYVEALAASGITQGYSDGTFRPTNPVTRAQMATFLARALGLHWPD